nr:hypothetical protein [Paenibacillus xylanexedens]
MNEQLKENILKEIKKTGFPFELSVSNNFANNSWSIDFNSYYIDKDEKKGREIDLIAGLHRQKTTNQQYIEFNWKMVIEIKQSLEKPWVFFTTKTNNFEKSLGFSRTIAMTDFSTPRPDIHKIFLEFGTKLNNRTGRSFYEALAKENKRDDIYKAISGVVKATSHLVESTDIESYADKLLYYYEPVIIFNGNLFEAYLDENNNIEVKQVDNMQLSFKYLSPNYDGKRYTIQIVTFNTLPDFIEKTEKKINAISEKLFEIESKNLKKGISEKK